MTPRAQPPCRRPCRPSRRFDRALDSEQTAWLLALPWCRGSAPIAPAHWPSWLVNFSATIAQSESWAIASWRNCRWLSFHSGAATQVCCLQMPWCCAMKWSMAAPSAGRPSCRNKSGKVKKFLCTTCPRSERSTACSANAGRSAVWPTNRQGVAFSPAWPPRLSPRPPCARSQWPAICQSPHCSWLWAQCPVCPGAQGWPGLSAACPPRH